MWVGLPPPPARIKTQLRRTDRQSLFSEERPYDTPPCPTGKARALQVPPTARQDGGVQPRLLEVPVAPAPAAGPGHHHGHHRAGGQGLAGVGVRALRAPSVAVGELHAERAGHQLEL